MFSGCEDSQTSADVGNVASFGLPDPAGKAGGACTSAMLNVLYKDQKQPDEDLSFQEVLEKVRGYLKTKSMSQIPQLSSSRPLDIQHPFSFISPEGQGTKRALMIGINYVGAKQGVLSGCHNDVKNMKEYLCDIHGFDDANITLLLDDGEHTHPTKANILEAMQTLVAETDEGDTVFFHYSGHGSKQRDTSGDEADGYDETLVPVDYESAGMIVDDDLLTNLVCLLPKGVYMTAMMDCCHSGTVFDLPYVFSADGTSSSSSTMHVNQAFDFDGMQQLVNMLKPMLEGKISKEMMGQVGQFLQSGDVQGALSKFLT